MLFNIIACLIIIISSFIFAYKNYKKCENVLERIFCVSMFFVVFVPIVLYYFDRYNVPTILAWSENVDTQNWLAFFSSYFSSIVGAVISSVVLVIVTFLQMDRTLKETQERDKEERRINNMPLLLFEFSNYIYNVEPDVIFTKYVNCNDYLLNMKLKNIGLNSVRKFIIEIDSETMNNRKIIKLGEQSCIDKGDEKMFYFLFQLPEGVYTFNIVVYYQDLLFNWYSQIIELFYSAGEQSFNSKISYNVLDEKRIKKPPSRISKLK